MKNKIKTISLGCAAVLMGGLLPIVQAAELNLSDSPLFVTSSSKPNVLMILDTSGSMSWAAGESTAANFVRGDDPTSKSEIARNALKDVVSSFAGRYNLGLMSYAQPELSPGFYRQTDGDTSPDTWVGGAGPGRGILNIEVGEVNSAKKTEFDNMLATEQFALAVDVPLRNGGGTSLEGTLLSAKDYFEGNLSVTDGGPGAALPNSCGYDFSILVTDGLPTVDQYGGLVGTTAEGITDTAVSAAALKAAGVDTFVLGFALPSEEPAGILDQIAVAGGTTQSYSADDAVTIKSTLNTIFSSITDTTGGGASVAANAQMLTTDSKIYQSSFNSSTWEGHLVSRGISTSGVLQAPDWDASTQLDAQDWSSGRKILTWDGSAAIKFRDGTISTDMKAALNDDPTTAIVDSDGKRSKRLQWIRGRRAAEFLPAATFRVRDHVLGDMVHSAPTYVGAPNFDYPANLEASSYTSFANSKASRTPMVYIGANDGMLHAFRADNGNEEFAYVPLGVFGNLSQLTSPGYSHKNYVDGMLTAGDAYVDGAWQSVLLGGLGGGGQSIFALDITNPTSVSEGSPANTVMWEFSDADLGYTYGQAAIVKMANGVWAAVFGNGYNNSEADGSPSTTGHAYLYVVNLETGVLIKKIDTGVGTVGTPNGLASPSPVDTDGDYIVDAIYAGDIRGNMWKFDVDGSNPTTWDVAYKSGSTPVPLFVAEDTSGTAQPITTRAEVARNSVTGDLLILFGTGKYLELVDTDPSNIGTQTFYGINDPGGLTSSYDRNDLVAQSVVSTTVDGAVEYRMVENNPVNIGASVKGWRLDLPDSGEMVISNPTLRFDQVVFTTAIPSSDVCVTGGESWFMEVDYLTGGRIHDGVIDVNGDGDVDSDDLLDFIVGGNTETEAVSGRKSGEGFLSAPLILSSESKATELKIFAGASGSIGSVTEKAVVSSVGRVSWRQLR